MKNKILIGILILTLLLRSGHFGYLAISVMSVVAVWYLIAQLFPKERWFKEIAALSLAVSQWHISLAGYSLKVSFAILLALLGISIWTKVLKGKWLFLSVAVLILVGNQIISPLALNLNNAPDVVWLTDQQRREHGEHYNGFLVLAFHNKVVNYSLSFIEHWGEHFSGDFFIPRSANLMLLVNILLLLLGFFSIIKKGDWSRWGAILLWLALAPINSAFNFGPPDMEKASLMIVPLVIISSFGAFTLFEIVKYFFQKPTTFSHTD